MTTSLRNVGFHDEIRLFTKKKLPATPIAVVYAFADSLISQGPDWLRSDEAKALVHTLNLCVHGRNYKVDGSKEQTRLEDVFEIGTPSIHQ
jgi:hypothetical protein